MSFSRSYNRDYLLVRGFRYSIVSFYTDLKPVWYQTQTGHAFFTFKCIDCDMSIYLKCFHNKLPAIFVYNYSETYLDHVL